MMCKKIRLTLVLAAVMLPLLVFARPKAADTEYAISVSAPQLKQQKMFLGKYIMGKLYVQDSLVFDDKGKGLFTSNKRLEEGMYVMYFSNNAYFDVLIGDDQHFTVKLDTTDLPKNIVFEDASQTGDFYTYSMRLFEKQAQVRQMVESTNNASDEKKKEADDQVEQMHKEMTAYQQSLIDKYPHSMISLFLTGLKVPEYNETAPKDPDSLKNIRRYHFYSRHYLDNLDLADERTFRTPYVVNTLDTYLNKVLVQSYDSIIPAALAMVERSRANEKTFRMVANHLLNYSVKSQLMGMDNLMVELANRYYLAGLTPWADSTLLSNLSKETRKLRYCKVGDVAHDMKVATLDDVYHNLYDLGGTQLTVLFFFEPQCGHCKKTAPLVKEFFEAYKDDPRIRLLAIYMLEDRKEWEDFLKEKGMEHLTNVWDPQRVSYYWQWYDTSSTPMIYVLDSNHKIIAKRIDVDTLKLITEHELK